MTDLKPKVLVPIFTNLATDYRCYKVVCSLRDMGFEPVIISNKTMSPLGPKWDAFEIRIITRTTLDRGMLNFAEFILRLVPQILFFGKYQMIFVEDGFPLLVCSVFGKFLGKEVIYDSHELWDELDSQIKNTFIKFFWVRWQAYSLLFIKKIICVSPLHIKALKNKYPKKDYFLLPNVPFKYQESLPEQKINHDNIKLIFSGYLRRDTNLEFLFNAIKGKEHISLTIVGEGMAFRFFKQQVEGLGIQDQVTFMGLVPFENIAGLLPGNHIGIDLLGAACSSIDLTWSNKTFDYIQAGLPVLMGTTAGHTELNKEYQVGVQVDPESAEDIIAGIEKLVEEYAHYADNAHKAGEQLCWEHYAKGLEQFVLPQRT
ncbi:MAG: glycosyltransferase [Fibrobacteria bacterium]|nr:glycosyltransferase [Fibrobacteria bacterium]